jgi:YHS domain-containing protein
VRLAFAAALVAISASAQPSPEECFASARDIAVESVTYEGKTYRFKRAGCRDLFESDRERYAQLFDALAELHGAGSEIKASETSLVPS